MEPKSSGNEVGQLAEAMTTTNAIIPLMHPCLGEILGRLCAVVAKVRVGYLSIKAYYFWGANEEKKKLSGAGEGPHMHTFVDQMAFGWYWVWAWLCATGIHDK